MSKSIYQNICVHIQFLNHFVKPISIEKLKGFVFFETFPKNLGNVSSIKFQNFVTKKKYIVLTRKRERKKNVIVDNSIQRSYLQLLIFHFVAFSTQIDYFNVPTIPPRMNKRSSTKITRNPVKKQCCEAAIKLSNVRRKNVSTSRRGGFLHATIMLRPLRQTGRREVTTSGH